MEKYGVTNTLARYALDRLLDYCEPIDHHLPEGERTGYEMFPDYKIVSDYLYATADVVPKSEAEFLRKTIADNSQKALEVTLEETEKAEAEIERLQAEIEGLKKSNEALGVALLYECEPSKDLLGDLEATVRKKVAREIFEDIDGKMLCFFPASSFVNAPNTSHYRLLGMLAELKKKYTEEKT